MAKEFEIARLTMIRAARSGEIDQARGFAWAHRIHPFHSTPLEEAFEDDFHIGLANREEVMGIIDRGWRSNKLVTFYEIEGFGGTGVNLGRMDIVAILRLAFLDSRFDEAVWRALVEPGSGPLESQGLADQFSVDDDLNY